MSEEKKNVVLEVQDGTIGASDAVQQVELNPNAPVTPVRTNPGPIYLRLMAVYEGDIPLQNDKPGKPAFMMLCQDLDGEQYMLPVTTAWNFWESLRKALQRIEPIVFGDDVVTKYKPEFSETPKENTNATENNTSDRSGVGEQDGEGEVPDGTTIH